MRFNMLWNVDIFRAENAVHHCGVALGIASTLNWVSKSLWVHFGPAVIATRQAYLFHVRTGEQKLGDDIDASSSGAFLWVRMPSRYLSTGNYLYALWRIKNPANSVSAGVLTSR